MSSDESNRGFVRHSRMHIRLVVLISMGAKSWEAVVDNISASGMLAIQPEDCEISTGQRCVLDLLVGEGRHIHLEALVTRTTAERIAFSFTRIPEEKEQILWDLLGHHADEMESPPGCAEAQ